MTFALIPEGVNGSTWEFRACSMESNEICPAETVASERKCVADQIGHTILVEV